MEVDFIDKTYLYPNALRLDLRTNLSLNADVSENTLPFVSKSINNFSDYDISQSHDWECPSLSPHVLLIVLYCIVLCCVVLCCAVSYRFVSYIIVFICIAQCVFKFDAFLNDHHSNVRLFYLTVLGYSHKGCFKDGRTRALPEHLSNFPQSELIVKCYQAAKAKGYKAFGCQYRTQCFSGPDAHNSYNKLGEATNCQDGTGGVWANDIYFII